MFCISNKQTSGGGRWGGQCRRAAMLVKQLTKQKPTANEPSATLRILHLPTICGSPMWRNCLERLPTAHSFRNEKSDQQKIPAESLDLLILLSSTYPCAEVFMWTERINNGGAQMACSPQLISNHNTCCLWALSQLN